MQGTVKKKHIDLTPFSIIFKYVLIANISEAFAKFQKELLYLLYQSGFKFRFQDGVFNPKESQIITASEHFIGKHRLCSR